MSEFAIIYGSLRGGIHLKPVTYKVMYLKLDTRTGHRCYRKSVFTQLQPKALLARIYVVKGKVFSGQ